MNAEHAEKRRETGEPAVACTDLLAEPKPQTDVTRQAPHTARTLDEAFGLLLDMLKRMKMPPANG